MNALAVPWLKDYTLNSSKGMRSLTLRSDVYAAECGEKRTSPSSALHKASKMNELRRQDGSATKYELFLMLIISKLCLGFRITMSVLFQILNKASHEEHKIIYKNIYFTLIYSTVLCFGLVVPLSIEISVGMSDKDITKNKYIDIIDCCVRRLQLVCIPMIISFAFVDEITSIKLRREEQRQTLWSILGGGKGKKGEKGKEGKKEGEGEGKGEEQAKQEGRLTQGYTQSD